MPTKRSGPTVIDVARLAKVSTSTAARVLRGADYPVDARLREQVLAAAAEAGYVPNLQARNLRRGDAGFIGLIVGSISDPFFGDIAQAVTERARQHSMLAIVANMQRDPRLELELCRNLWGHRVAGLILSGGSFDQFTHAEALAELVGRMTGSGTIVVSLAHRKLAVPTISVDNFASGAMLASHVLGFGHRDIGIVFGPPNSLLNRERLRGLTETFGGAGATTAVEHAEPQAAAGAAAAAALLARHPGISVIVAGGDMLAVGIAEHLARLGRRVPEDISLTGVGNTPYAQLLRPTLTTMDVGIAGCGAAAVDYIIEAVRTPSDRATAGVAAIAPFIVPGESLGRPRDAHTGR